LVKIDLNASRDILSFPKGHRNKNKRPNFAHKIPHYFTKELYLFHRASMGSF
jgi:hypothetical protein